VSALPYAKCDAPFCGPAAANETTFTPTVVGVFTWFAVGRYSAGVDRLNTFQAVIASHPGECLSTGVLLAQ